jgi:23S rRNA (adenine2503-C2)-methyltransferase
VLSRTDCRFLLQFSQSFRLINMEPIPNNSLLGLDFQELTNLMDDLGQKPYRARQVYKAIYGERVETVDGISPLPLELRSELTTRGIGIGLPTIDQKFTSVDGTIRYLIGLNDGQTVETVWMPNDDGGEPADVEAVSGESARGWDRATICVSSQVGCAVDCQFCLTAQLKMKRNLTAGEIIGQVAAVIKERGVNPPTDRINLVFMGMGEPFLNYDNFIKAVRLMVEGVGIPASRMTVSTAGIVPRIYDLGAEEIRPRLAISLNASNDELRTRIMPINRKWNLEKLMAAARDYPLRNREKVTFEYVLLDGVNDEPQNAREVIDLISGMRASVNLIALNPGPGIEFRTPERQRVLDFQNILIAAGIQTYIRRPRGRDIFAACGQLKRTVETAAVS